MLYNGEDIKRSHFSSGDERGEIGRGREIKKMLMIEESFNGEKGFNEREDD